MDDELSQQQFLALYDLGEPVGEGAMAEVRCGFQKRLGRPVAIKLMLPGQALAPDWSARFARETRVLAELNHPHIVRIFDAGVLRGRPFIVMELLTGGSLVDLLERDGPLAPGRAVELFAPLAQALAYLHRERVLHRDIKPQNVLMAGSGDLKLADFGIARHLNESQSITRTGEVVGSPLYLAPEAFEAGSLELASDVYSFGCTLFAALCGEPPFESSSGGVMDLIRRKLTNRPPPVTVHVPGAPAGLVALVDRCLAPALADRPTAGELAGAMERLAAQGARASPARPGLRAAGREAGAPPASLAAVSRLRGAAAVAVVLAAVLGASWWWRGASSRPGPWPSGTATASAARPPAALLIRAGVSRGWRSATCTFATAVPARLALSSTERGRVVSPELKTGHRLVIQGLDPGRVYSFAVEAELAGGEKRPLPAVSLPAPRPWLEDLVSRTHRIARHDLVDATIALGLGSRSALWGEQELARLADQVDPRHLRETFEGVVGDLASAPDAPTTRLLDGSKPRASLAARAVETVYLLDRVERAARRRGSRVATRFLDLMGQRYWVSATSRLAGGAEQSVSFGADGIELVPGELNATARLLVGTPTRGAERAAATFFMPGRPRPAAAELRLDVAGLDRGAELEIEVPAPEAGLSPVKLQAWRPGPDPRSRGRETVHIGFDPRITAAGRCAFTIRIHCWTLMEAVSVTLHAATLRLSTDE